MEWIGVKKSYAKQRAEKVGQSKEMSKVTYREGKSNAKRRGQTWRGKE